MGLQAKDAVSYFETTWKEFPEGAEVEEQALLPSTAEGQWLFQAGGAAFFFDENPAATLRFRCLKMLRVGSKTVGLGPFFFPVLGADCGCQIAQSLERRLGLLGSETSCLVI